MPLYMDFHKFENVTVEDVKKAHVADLSIQETYGVRYHQFWVNQEAGSVFCLMEGPDAATCEKVHRLAHGNVACAMTEVEAGFYKTLMGTGHTIDHGHVQKPDGGSDTGYRTIMAVAMWGLTKATATSRDLSLFFTPFWARKIVQDQIGIHHGRPLEWEGDESLLAVFDDADQAVQCALAIQKECAAFEDKCPEIIFKIGVAAAQPVTAKADFFSAAVKFAHRLCLTARDNQLLTSPLVKKLCTDKEIFQHQVKALTLKEEEFLEKVIQSAEQKICDQRFDVNQLSSDLCVSRPQLYRKVIAVTGQSPNNFIRDLRIMKALALLRKQRANIAEIAYDTGFNSPSYFTKCFTAKFGLSPSAFVRNNLD